MVRVAVVQFSPNEGPGYFSEFLNRVGAIEERIALYQPRARLPKRSDVVDAWCLMGSPASVHDAAPWREALLALIQDALKRSIPVIGHCFGGQFIALALGAAVRPNPTKEIGWHPVWVTQPEAAKRWLGEMAQFVAFHWHGETFEIPEGAEHWLASPFCAHQAFSIGPHLALQCHVEMTDQMIKLWCAEWDQEGVSPGAAVQAPQTIVELARFYLPQLHQVADRLYHAWWQGVAQ